MTEHSTYIKISSDHENATESFLHTIKNIAADGERYGVDIEIERIDPNDFAEVDFE